MTRTGDIAGRVPSPTHSCSFAWVSLVLAAVFSMAQFARADDYTWIGAGTGGNTATDPADPTTLWNQPGNWDLGSVPGSSDVAHLSFANAGYANATSTWIGSVYVDGTSLDGALRIGDGAKFGPDDIYVGQDASGKVIQDGGMHDVDVIYLGHNAGSNGTYELHVGELRVYSYACVGYEGTGTFTQTGGTNGYYTASLCVGYSPGSVGTYHLDGGNLSESSLRVGYQGTGTFTQTGGTHTIAGTLEISPWTSPPAGSGTYNLGGTGRLTATNERICYSGWGTGLFTQTGGENTVTAGLSIGNGGKYDLQGGTLTVGTVDLDPGGTFEQTGGMLNATIFNQSGGAVEVVLLQNRGTFNYTGGTFSGRLVNLGTADFSANFTAGDGAENYGSLAVPLGRTLTFNGVGLTNGNTLTLEGGEIRGTGVTNDFGGQMSGKGTMATNFTNNGSLTLTGLLTVTGAAANAGTITVGNTRDLRTSGGFDNTGTVTISGGSLSGSASVNNGPGGVIQGSGGISAPLTNDGGFIRANGAGASLVIPSMPGGNVNGGELHVADNSTLAINSSFPSTGLIVLNGADALLSGGAVTNTGTIRGQGRVTNTVHNSGVIRAEGGQLTLSGPSATNTSTGQIEAAIGTVVFYTQGLSVNEGMVVLRDATFDTNNRTMTNAPDTGAIVGRGTLRTGGLTNDNLVSLADGTTDIYGAVTNNKNILFDNATAAFYGLVTNASSGNIKNTAGTVRFLAGLVNNGSYASDPADNYFTDLSLGPTGQMVGGAGDRFFVSGSMTNAGTFTSSGTLEAGHVNTSGSFAQTGTTNIRSGAQFVSSGTTTIGGIQGWGAGCVLNADAGSTTFNSDAGAGGANLTVNVNDSAEAHFGVSQHLAALNVGDSGGGDTASAEITGGVLVTDALHIDNDAAFTSSLDVHTRHLVVDYTGASPIATIEAMVAAGANSAAGGGLPLWNGPGIMSTEAQPAPNPEFAVGVADNAALAGFGVGIVNFGGTAVEADDVLARYTYQGDATLNGVTDGMDYALIDYAAAGGLGSSPIWMWGDFNYDGVIDGMDYALIDFVYAMHGGGGGLGPLGGDDDPFGGKAPALIAPTAVVPEPATVLLMAGAALPLLLRRRRKA